MTSEVEIAARNLAGGPDPRRAQADRLAPGAVEAIVNASHSDPFAVLGPHQVGPDRWEIRAMAPDAQAIDVLDWSGTHVLAAMERRHAAGFFVAGIKSAERPGYRLRVQTAHGTHIRVDPYSYGPILSNQELGHIRDVGSDAPYRVLGAHPRRVGEIEGFLFAVWAPNAQRVSVVGDFNNWDGRTHPLRLRHQIGVW